MDLEVVVRAREGRRRRPARGRAGRPRRRRRRACRTRGRARARRSRPSCSTPSPSSGVPSGQTWEAAVCVRHRRRIMPPCARVRARAAVERASTDGLAYARFAVRRAAARGRRRRPARRGLVQGEPLRLRPRCAAAAGLAAIAFDARGHGASDGRAGRPARSTTSPRIAELLRGPARARRCAGRAWAASWRSSRRAPARRRRGRRDLPRGRRPACARGAARRALRLPRRRRRARRAAEVADERAAARRAGRAACCSCTPRATSACPSPALARAARRGRRQPAGHGARRPPPLGPARRRAAGARPALHRARAASGRAERAPAPAGRLREVHQRVEVRREWRRRDAQGAPAAPAPGRSSKRWRMREVREVGLAAPQLAPRGAEERRRASGCTAVR